MTREISINISYWRSVDGVHDLVGVDDFRHELDAHYVARVHGRRSDAAGGGLYEFAIEIITNLSLTDLLGGILAGAAYDLAKIGTKLFALRPFLLAYRKLKSLNPQELGICELNFMFNDAEVTVSAVTPIENQLDRIFQTLASKSEELKSDTGEFPYSILIPVFKNPDSKYCQFRSLLDVDETISDISAESYFEYWGLWYDQGTSMKVFDVKQGLSLDATYMTQQEYWRAWERDFARSHPSELD